MQNELSWRKSAPEFLRRAAETYGPICEFKLRGKNVHLVSDPELVREVLVSKEKHFHKGPGFQKMRPWLGNSILLSEEEEHKRKRRLSQPSFHRKRIEGYARVMTECADKAAASLKAGATVEILPFMENTTFGIATRCIFDADTDAVSIQIFTAVHQAVRYLDTLNSYSPAALFQRWSGKAEKEKTESIRILHHLVDDIITSRRKDTQDRGDLLSMLVSTLDEEGDGKGLTDEEIRHEVLTFLVAGFDTLSSTMTTCLYFLSTHPEAEAAVLEEMKQHLDGRTATFAEVPALVKTSAALAEALRLYPAAWVLPRTVIEPVEIGGHLLPKKATVLVSSYVNQRNPQYFPEPDRFDLDRWSPEKKDTYPKFSYFPFGSGSHVCIGEHFARMEAVILLSALLQRWRFEPAFTGPMPYRSTVSLRPSNECPVYIHKR